MIFNSLIVPWYGLNFSIIESTQVTKFVNDKGKQCNGFKRVKKGTTFIQHKCHKLLKFSEKFIEYIIKNQSQYNSIYHNN